MAVSVSIARLSVKFFSSHCLLGEGGSFGPGCCCFFFAAGCCCFRFKMASLFFTYHSSLYCFTVSGSWLGMTKVVSVKGVRLIAIVLSDNHSPRSRDGTGEGNLVPIGSTHDVPPDDQTPHLRIRFPPITWFVFHQALIMMHHLIPFPPISHHDVPPDDHLICFHPFQIMWYHVFCSIKAIPLIIQITSTVSACFTNYDQPCS